MVELQDYAMGQVEANATLRARQLCKVLSGLGAAFVKIGQALSSRPDLLPQVYLEVGCQLLTSLQVAVTAWFWVAPGVGCHDLKSIIQRCGAVERAFSAGATLVHERFETLDCCLPLRCCVK